jgi:hypothetical protein
MQSPGREKGVRELPILVATGQRGENNFHVWSEILSTKVTREFGSALAGIILQDEIVYPPMPKASDYGVFSVKRSTKKEHPIIDEEEKEGMSNNTSLTKTVTEPVEEPPIENILMLKCAISEYNKRLSQIEDNKPKMAAVMWDYTSKESREMICSSQDFVKEQHQFDPVRLWKAIKSTHRSGSSAPDANSRRDEARHAYQSLRQGPYENTTDFVEHFRYLKKCRDDAGNSKISDEEMVGDFLHAIDNIRFAVYKADIANDKLKGIPGPSTLQEAYTRAMRYVVAKPNPKNGLGAAFATRVADIGQQDRNRGGRGGRGGRGRGNDSSRGGHEDYQYDNNECVEREDSSLHEKSKGRSIVCWHCGEEGYVRNNCAEWLAFSGESSRRSKSTYAT